MPEWEAVTHDLTEKLEWQSEQSRRLEENLDNATRELTSNQHDLLIAKERIENLGSRQQYEDEQHRATTADLENKIDVACVKDDTGKAQLSVDLHESVRAFGELQGELTGKVRQLDLIQTEIKRITDSKGELTVENERLDRQAALSQNELQRVTDVNTVTEKNNIRLSKDISALEFTLARKEKELAVLKVNERRLKENVSHLEMSVQGQSQKAVDSSCPGAESVVAKLISEVANAKAEKYSREPQQWESSTA